MLIDPHKSNPSTDLFNEILKQGVGYIDDAISSKTSENYYLDFKTTQEQDYTRKRTLLASEKKNYARCISAFGNGEGGVIVWGVKTGSSDADYASKKKPITNVSNFASLLEGLTSTLTSPPHPKVVSKIVFQDEKKDTGYVITHVEKSNQRPFQVLNENEFKYYIRAGSSSKGAPDTFVRGLLGSKAQPDVWIQYLYSPMKVSEEGEVKIQVGIMLHNGGESIARHVNGYVRIGGLPTANLQINSLDDFDYNKVTFIGKIGFVAKPHFILGVEQEVQPLIMEVTLKKPIPGDGFLFETLINSENQVTRRTKNKVSKKELEKIYNAYIKDNKYDILATLLGKEE